MKKLFITMVTMFSLSLGTVTSNIAIASGDNCFPITLSCGVNGEYCYGPQQTTLEIVSDIWYYDYLICG